MQSTTDHDLLIRLATLLEGFEKDVDEIREDAKDLPDIRIRLRNLENSRNAAWLRNNALIIATATNTVCNNQHHRTHTLQVMMAATDCNAGDSLQWIEPTAWGKIPCAILIGVPTVEQSPMDAMRRWDISKFRQALNLINNNNNLGYFVTGRMKIVVVVLVVVVVWIVGSSLFGGLIFSGIGPSQPVVRTQLPPKPTNNSTAAAVISSSIDIGAAVRGLQGAPYPVVNLSGRTVHL
jgi:hypothetical protein